MGQVPGESHTAATPTGRRFFKADEIMNSLLLHCLSPALSAGAYAQGYIYFDNRVLDANIDAPVFRPDGSGAGAGFTAGLFLVTTGGSLEPLFPTTKFHTTSPGTPYVLDVVVPMPGTWSGDVVTVRMRAWETGAGDYAAALIRGESNDVRLTLAAGFPIDLLGLQGFTMVVVPEPGSGTLVTLGGAALVAASRRPRASAGSPRTGPGTGFGRGDVAGAGRTRGGGNAGGRAAASGPVRPPPA